MLPARALLRDHPRLVDGALAVLLLSSGADEWPRRPPVTVAATLVVSVVLAALVLPRRRYPVTALTVALGIAAAQVVFGMWPGTDAVPVRALEPTMTDLVIPVLLYTVAVSRTRRVSVTALAACLLAAAVAIARWAPAQGAYPQGALFAAGTGLGGTALAAWVLGDSVAFRYRRAWYTLLEERTARAEAERDAQARMAAAERRARELAGRRARAVDESAARLRRIERDLHDGAQVRLTALAMTLGEIKEHLENGPGGADGGHTRMLVGTAHENAKATLAELRDLARGIHPPVLDRGLAAALASLAAASQVPARVDAACTGWPSPAITAIAYFCAAELLANAAKHSGASEASLTVRDQAGRFVLTVADNGAGGARLTPGGGLAGLLERVQTVDGSLTVDSPAGGPTTVTVELPGHA